MQNTIFSKKLSNLELWCLLTTTHRKLCNWAYQRTHYWIPKIDMTSFFSDEGGPILIKFRRLVQNDVDCDDVVEIETRCIIPIWRTFGRIPRHVIPESPARLHGASTWRIQCHDPTATCHITGCCHRRIQQHVIPEPRITLQGAATWWIHCHDFRATCHIAGCSHLAKSISWSCHVEGCNVIIPSAVFAIFNFFVILMKFGLWRVAAFVSPPIDLLPGAGTAKPEIKIQVADTVILASCSNGCRDAIHNEFYRKLGMGFSVNLQTV